MKKATKKKIKAIVVRAIRTVAQTAVATIGTATLMSEIQWSVVISTSLVAGLLSILMSISGLPECQDGNCKGVM